jgi:hypothetical protein
MNDRDPAQHPDEGVGWPLLLSGDGSPLAYAAGSPGAESVVVNGRQGPLFESVRGVAVSADGSTVAYLAETGEGPARSSATVGSRSPDRGWSSWS